MPSKNHIKISVSSLVQLVEMQGDIKPGSSGASRLQQGTQGHQLLQQDRPQGYKAEVPISHEVETDTIRLTLTGRIDGIFTAEDPVIIEEIKTTEKALEHLKKYQPAVHWSQARCYAFIYAHQNKLEAVTIQLTYYQLNTKATLKLKEIHSYASLESAFHKVVDIYTGWMEAAARWQASRNESIKSLKFPFMEYRAGQRDLAVASYRAIIHEKHLFAQAPTGTGKTMAILFPALKALGEGHMDKVFYLTAKTIGRTAAEKALNILRQKGLLLKSVTLTAKDKVCFKPGAGCDPDKCSYARGYYDKVAAIFPMLYKIDNFDRTNLEALAKMHELCPFELSLDAALISDCIICDYNYVFDPRVYLKRFFDPVSGAYTFLVDESHNLPDRAREMFSASIYKKKIQGLKKSLHAHLPGIAQALQALNAWLLEKRKECDSDQTKFLVKKELSGGFITLLRTFTRRTDIWLQKNEPASFKEDLLNFYFEALAYLKVAELFGEEYVSYFEKYRGSNLLARLFCTDPATQLSKALKRARSVIFFSGTLLPMGYFKRVIAGNNGALHVIIPSPFPAENLNLIVHRGISTKFTMRESTYGLVASVLQKVYTSRPGNYIFFFPSYTYMEQVAGMSAFSLYGGRVIVQERRMDEAARESFLDEFRGEAGGPVCAFAVMGGIFGEGIDLPGDRLIGAVIVGVGLPQICLERDLIRQQFEENEENGFAFAYQLPGLNRVMQAVGRVIRSEEDRGTVILIDERFASYRYTELYPGEWNHFKTVDSNEELEKMLQGFWLG